MTPDRNELEELKGRVRVLEMENELLSDRAEDIAMLGLVAEQIEISSDPQELLTAVLERICILKGLPCGVCLEGAGPLLHVKAAYHLREAEASATDQFQLRESATWPPTTSLALDPEGYGRIFEQLTVAGLPAAPSALVLVPRHGGRRHGRCLVFADEGRSPEELGFLLPLIERVADLTEVRLENLSLVAKLEQLNQGLDQEVAERTKELRLSEARYRTLFDHVPDGVLLVDADDEGSLGRIVEANEAAAAMHGYSLKEILQLDVEALNAPGPGPRLDSFEARVWHLDPGETVQEELPHRRKDGSTFPVESIGTLVNLQGRQYLLAFSRDISERKEAEQVMLQTQRTESVGLLAGGIAHDFNNLLTAIMGQTGIAMDLLEPEAPGRDNLGKAMSAAEKAATLTQQMLAYSGRGKFTIQPVSLNWVILENLEFLQAAISKQVTFHLDLDEAMVPITGDPSQLQQVIMNLVINGAEAIGEGAGTITIRTRCVSLDSVDQAQWPLSGNSLTPGEFVLVEVSDTGCGMSPEVCARVFDPFFSTKPKGHGLGLSAVQGIIRGHRGGLAVQSEVGVGTSFKILLPTGNAELARALPQSPGETATTPRTVLVIDDEDYMLEVVRDILGIHGHAALLAISGEKGIEMMRLFQDRIDLVLLDLTMPGLSGVETCRHLRQVAPWIPVILSSGFAVEEATGQMRDMDLAGFLQKPYLAADFLRMVEAVPIGSHRKP